MNDDSIVVMESGAGWPTWVDEEAGAASSVVVLSRHRGETADDFEARARSRLGSLAELRAPRRGILVCETLRADTTPASRERLLRILCDVIGRAGGDEVVLIGDDAKLIQRLSRSTRLSLRLRSAPASAERAAEKRVA